MVEWVQKKLDDHRAAFDPDKIEDFIDAYLGAAQHLQRNEAKKTSLTGEYIAHIGNCHARWPTPRRARVGSDQRRCERRR